MAETKAQRKQREAEEEAASEKEFQKVEKAHDAEVAEEVTLPPAAVVAESGIAIEAAAPPPPPTPKPQPVFSREGVLMNPQDCHVGHDGVVRAKE